ncbi:MAG: glycosyltransferase family 4 protein [Ilumatobacteraceae bacterium]|nr:glycosyltransferase family 4 protein [Ilumatobacteraceae bacterium]
MRIAQIAPLYEAVPPAKYGGTERVIAAICDGLVALGHEVTLFAAATSATAAELVEVVPTPLRQWMTREEMLGVAPHLHLRMLADIYDRAGDFDVIHSHADIWTLPFALRSATPTVLTMHGRLDLEHVRQTLPLYPDVPMVSISAHQRDAVRDIAVNWVGTIHNGLDLGHYHVADQPRGGHLAFVGRINPEKGPALAVEIARRTDRELRVAAKIDPMDVDYYRGEIEPLFAANAVRFIGELAESEKPAFYASASATLFPSDWPEPFGLVMIESMAAGTPVIALRRGSVPEVIVDGVTGFVCDDLDQMVQAIEHVGEIDPDDCRRRAASFDAATMCAGYEQMFRSQGQRAEQLTHAA